MEILIPLIFGLVLYLLYRASKVDIPNSSLKEDISSHTFALEESKAFEKSLFNHKFSDDDDDFYDTSSSSVYDDFYTSSSSFDDDDSCSLSRALWDPSCPLYHVLHDDSSSCASSSWDDDWSSSSWDDSWSSSSSWDDD